MQVGQDIAESRRGGFDTTCSLCWRIAACVVSDPESKFIPAHGHSQADEPRGG